MESLSILNGLRGDVFFISLFLIE